MKVTFDPSKRDLTLKHRALDFARAAELFAGLTATIADDRFDYGELRFMTAGHLDGRLVVTVWTQRDEARHIISMRPHHLDETLSCQGRENLGKPHGAIPMTHRN